MPPAAFRKHHPRDERRNMQLNLRIRMYCITKSAAKCMLTSSGASCGITQRVIFKERLVVNNYYTICLYKQILPMNFQVHLQIKLAQFALMNCRELQWLLVLATSNFSFQLQARPFIACTVYTVQECMQDARVQFSPPCSYEYDNQRHMSYSYIIMRLRPLG